MLAAYFKSAGGSLGLCVCVCVLANSVRHIERELLAALIQRRIAKFEALTKSSFFLLKIFAKILC